MMQLYWRLIYAFRAFRRRDVPSAAHEVWPLLKALGAPDNCREFKLIARVDEPVTVEATFFPHIKNGKLQTEIKRYVLKEITDDAER